MGCPDPLLVFGLLVVDDLRVLVPPGPQTHTRTARPTDPNHRHLGPLTPTSDRRLRQLWDTQSLDTCSVGVCQPDDMLWEKLSAGRSDFKCGRHKDKYGRSWQIGPTVLPELMADPTWRVCVALGR